ncbi:DUF2603 domain-containing protein [Helicobacter winghamensis]|uniref:DUF2603 domain-containing protein n=1 Tax=Helicobacter winghamensis TaxID=157268 RepID=A0A2N3PKC5_9HELI|nr:DUF2603 domain-containing protein [Helicobacter winghamensis]EEO25924.1 hypothetical protein HWAG_00716 [Helicobacter winghamensis ATCC BAA-430]PKT76941.1 hypothetical protein BCM34_07110 [Helicobacter winghamensis]PKT77081.1 hypothetical protein BCM35_03195 [Helicobacter winghamensis]PKT77643.1 hypothetical protein BCM32_05470 [Helicobacter winghamensis]PKT81881.1 hypothetical protein BCM31_01465 [Helicobacter winghamensis]
MATPKPLKAQEHYKVIKNMLKNTNMESLNYDSTLKENEIYSLLDCNNQEFYLIPKKTMQTLINKLKNFENDKYLFKLKQEIYKNMPVDFDDVWCIALNEIKDYKKDPKDIVKHLKKCHPYLFLNFLDKLK